MNVRNKLDRLLRASLSSLVYFLGQGQEPSWNVFHLGRLLSYLQTLYHTGKASKGMNTLAYYEIL